MFEEKDCELQDEIKAQSQEEKLNWENLLFHQLFEIQKSTTEQRTKNFH